MPTVQQILNTIDVEYRNTFTDSEKVAWMNTIQHQIYQKVRHEAVPYYFTTVSGNAFYPLPSDCDFKGIKQVTIETKASSGKYSVLRYVSVESDERFSTSDEFYSIQDGSNLFLNPIPTAATAGRKVYLYYNKKPTELSTASLSATPDLEEDFHELLVLGVLERIARARGEYEDKANFAADYNSLLREYVNQHALKQPEYYRTKDLMKRRRGSVYMKIRGEETVDT